MLLGAVSTPEKRAARPLARVRPQAACPKRSAGTGRGSERSGPLPAGVTGAGVEQRRHRGAARLQPASAATGFSGHQRIGAADQAARSHGRGAAVLDRRASGSAQRRRRRRGGVSRAVARERWKPAGGEPQAGPGARCAARQRGPARRATPRPRNCPGNQGIAAIPDCTNRIAPSEDCPDANHPRAITTNEWNLDRLAVTSSCSAFTTSTPTTP